MARDEKSKRSRRDRTRDKPKPPTKIVIRHLPPTMTEEEFLKQIDPLPEHDFYYFADADWSLGFDATCRAYITFKNYDDVFLFRDRFDGYVFVDNKGNEYAAIIEFAPFQGLLKNKSRNSDNKVNTIEQESHYQDFLKKLEEERDVAAKGGETKLEFSLESKKEEITSTPLLQYLASKKEKRREDAKKRTAEKKKRREDEREKRKHNQSSQHSIKILSTPESASSRAEKSKEEKCMHNKEEPKNSRARRREERNRLRHEAYLQKKKTFEDERKQAGQNSNTENNNNESKKDKGNDSGTKSPDGSKPIELLKKSKADQLTESVLNFILSAATNLPTATSEGKTEEDIKTESKANSTQDLNKLQDKISKMDINKEAEKERKFFKEPRDHEKRGRSSPKLQNKRYIEEQKKQAKQEKYKGNIGETKSSSNSSNSLEKKFDEASKEETKSQYKEQGKREKLTQKQIDEKREERRIRNKDRPSIAIYQPKARLRMSEESDSNSVTKDIMRSHSTSDCETGKKEELPQQKKVQRYSERSKNRKSHKETEEPSEMNNDFESCFTN